jgi:hypothetical protein
MMRWVPANTDAVAADEVILARRSSKIEFAAERPPESEHGVFLMGACLQTVPSWKRFGAVHGVPPSYQQDVAGP